MSEPTPRHSIDRVDNEPTNCRCYIELDPGFDHDAIERELDEQIGLTPKPKRERSWDCLAGEAPVACSHVRISREPVGDGLTRVTCECGQTWSEVE